jgi:hypothetical protein
MTRRCMMPYEAQASLAREERSKRVGEGEGKRGREAVSRPKRNRDERLWRADVCVCVCVCVVVYLEERFFQLKVV